MPRLTYISRSADKAILEAFGIPEDSGTTSSEKLNAAGKDAAPANLQSNRYFYIPSPAQTGKSLLTQNIQAALERHGYVCICISPEDISGADSIADDSEEAFYNSFYGTIVDKLVPKSNRADYYQPNEVNEISSRARIRELYEVFRDARLRMNLPEISEEARSQARTQTSLKRFLSQVIFEVFKTENIVFLFDDIDLFLARKFSESQSLKTIKFRQDFLTYFCNFQQSTNSDYRRLSCLVTASDVEFIEQHDQIIRSAFTVASLKDFSQENLLSNQSVQSELVQRGIIPEERGTTIENFLELTKGHPALTDSLIGVVGTSLGVEAVIQEEQINSRRKENSFLYFLTPTEDYLEKRENEETLGLLGKIIANEEKILYSPDDVIQARLLRLGLIRRQNNERLVCHNPIFEKVCRHWTCFSSVVKSLNTNNIAGAESNQTSEGLVSNVSEESNNSDGLESPRVQKPSQSPQYNSAADEAPATEAESIHHENENSRRSSKWKAFLRNCSIAVLVAIMPLLQSGTINPIAIAMVFSATVLLFVLKAPIRTSRQNSNSLGGQKQEAARRAGTAFSPFKLFRGRQNRRRWAMLMTPVIAVCFFWFGFVKSPNFLPHTFEDLNRRADQALDVFYDNNLSEIEALGQALKVVDDKIRTEELSNRLVEIARSIRIIKKFAPKKIGKTPLKPELTLRKIYSNITERHRLSANGYKELSDIHSVKNGSVVAIATRDNAAFGSGGSEGWLMLWPSTTTQQPNISETSVAKGISAVNLSSDGQYVARAKRDGTVEIFVSSNLDKVVRTLEWGGASSSGNEIRTVEFRSSNEYLIAIKKNGDVKGWRTSLKENTEHGSGSENAFAISLGDVSGQRWMKIWSLDSLAEDSNKELVSQNKQFSIGRFPKNFFSDDSKTDVSYTPNAVKIYNINSSLVEFSSGAKAFDIYIGGEYTDPQTQEKRGVVERMILQFDPDSSKYALSSLGKDNISEFNEPVIDIGFESSIDKSPLYVFGRSGVISILPSTDNGEIKLAGLDEKEQMNRNYSVGEGEYGHADFSFTGDRGEVMISDREPEIRLWDFSPKINVALADNVPGMSDVLIEDIAADLSPMNKSIKIAVLGNDGIVYLFSNALAFEGQIPRLTPNRKVTAVSWDRDGDRLITGHENGAVFSWDTDARQPKELNTSDFSEGKISDFSYGSPRSSSEVTAVSSQGSIRLYKEGNKEPSEIKNNPFIKPSFPVNVSVSPQAHYLLSTSKEGEVKAFDISEPTKFLSISLKQKNTSGKSQDIKVKNIAWLPKYRGKQGFGIAVGLMSDSQNICFWKLPLDTSDESPSPYQAYRCIKPNGLENEDNPWVDFAFSKEGEYMALISEQKGSASGKVQVFDISEVSYEKAKDLDNFLSENLIAEFEGDWGSIVSMKFAYDNNLIIGGNNGYLAKFQIGEEEKYMEWGCQWLDDYRQVNSDSYLNKICRRKDRDGGSKGAA